MGLKVNRYGPECEVVLCCLNIGFKSYQVAELGGRRCVERTGAQL